MPAGESYFTRKRQKIIPRRWRETLATESNVMIFSPSICIKHIFYCNNNREGGIIMTVASQLKKTLASLKGNQGTLELYALQTRNEETKAVYTETIKDLGIIINDLERREQILEFEEPQYKGN